MILSMLTIPRKFPSVVRAPPPPPPHIVRKTPRVYCTVLTATHSHAIQSGAKCQSYIHKNEQSRTSDRLVKTSDPLINRLRQHPFSTALSQLYLTRSGKSSSSSSETRRSRHSIVTARHGPTNLHFQLTFLRLRTLPANEFFSRLFTRPQCGMSPIFLPSLTLTSFILSATQHINRRQAMYYKRNIEKRSRNHCCHRKAISIKYPECVSVTLVTQHVIPMRRIIQGFS